VPTPYANESTPRGGRPVGRHRAECAAGRSAVDEALHLLGVVVSLTWFFGRGRASSSGGVGASLEQGELVTQEKDLDLLAGLGSSSDHDPAQERGEHLVDQPERHRRIMPGVRRRRSSRSADVNRVSGTHTPAICPRPVPGAVRQPAAPAGHWPLGQALPMTPAVKSQPRRWDRRPEVREADQARENNQQEREANQEPADPEVAQQNDIPDNGAPADAAPVPSYDPRVDGPEPGSSTSSETRVTPP
jgi:hypothetical protein